MGRFLGKRFPRQGPAWSTHEFGCRQNNVHRPTVAGQAEGEGYLARYHVHDHKICKIFFGPNISKTNNFLPNTNSPPGLPSDKANPTLPPPPATTCDHLPPPPPQHLHPHHQPSTTFCPSFAASSTSNDDDHREPSNPGTAHNLLFKRHDDERFTHRAPRFPSSPPTSHLASDSIAPGRPNSLAARRRTTTTPPNQTKPKPNNRNHEPPSSKENRRQGKPPAPIHPLLSLPPTIPN